MRPELLSPAGSPEALRAAVLSGADAVYLGWGDFNARRNAKNFSDEEFAQALTFCHERGVRVYLTLNTLLTDRELPRALELAAQASALGVDAVLVQDLGLLALMREALPDLPLHASTQMSIFTSGGARQAWDLGCRRIVLARECSREDTERICRESPAEVEIFAHGALCMCYSGQCAMSALIGGRSGNRGKCAQPCRLPYGVDEKAAGRYPLSLKDSCLAPSLAEAAEMGVACLKLEGRMKRPEYVAVVTGIYARLLREQRPPTAAETSELEQAFSRSGFTSGYWNGQLGPKMFGTRPENAPEPKELFDRARAEYEKGGPGPVAVDLSCSVLTGEPCALTAADRDGHSVTVTGPVPEAARTRALDGAELEARLRKTGGTAFHCENVVTLVDEGLSLPASAINALRRAALAALSEARTAPPQRRRLAPSPLPEARPHAGAPAYTLSLTTAAQLTPELLALGPQRVLLPLEVLAGLKALPAGDTQWCALLPRVWRDTDEPLLLSMLERAKALGVTGVYVGNLGQLPLLKGQGFALYGDYGLNIFNGRALAELGELGLESATLSFELKLAQLRDLPKTLPAEAIVYGRLPLMITENCLIRNAGRCPVQDPFRDPVPPCGQGHSLCDRTGAAFPLLPAFGHRTEIQNSRPVYLADRQDWKSLGLSFARLRFTDETPEECVRVFRAYQEGLPPVGLFTRGLYDRGVE
jgi:putative protease